MSTDGSGKDKIRSFKKDIQSGESYLPFRRLNVKHVLLQKLGKLENFHKIINPGESQERVKIWKCILYVMFHDGCVTHEG